MSLDQKLTVASEVLKSLQTQKDEQKVASEKLIETLESLLVVSEKKLTDVKKEALDFKKVVVEEESNVLLWMKRREQNKKTQTERLSIKCKNLRSSKRKLETMLKEMEDARKSLQYIHFHKMQITCDNLSTEVEKLNKELLSLKEEVNKSELKNKNAKELLENSESEHTSLLKRKVSRQKQRASNAQKREKILSKLRDERKVLEQSNSVSCHKSNLLEEEVVEDQQNTPKIDEYLALKASFHELEKDIKGWKRKVSIAQISCK